MSMVCRFLALILCFELIVQPLNLGLINSAQAQSTNCPAGTVFSEFAGKCQATATTTANTQTKNECLSSTSSDADYNACLLAKVQNQASEAGKTDMNSDGANLVGGFGGNQVGGMAVVSAAMVAVPLVFVGASLANSESKITDCTPPSLLFMYAGAAAYIAGEVYSFIAHKENVKRMDDRLTELTKANTESVGGEARVAQGTNVQKGSIEILADNEASLAEVARNKAIFYGISTGLFAAGVIAGIAESVMLGTAKAQLANPLIKDKSVPNQTIKNLTCRNPAGDKGDKKAGGAANGSGNASGSGQNNQGGGVLDTAAKVAPLAQTAASTLGGAGKAEAPAETPAPSSTTPAATSGDSSNDEAHRLWRACQNTGIDPNSAACQEHKDFLDNQNDAQGETPQEAGPQPTGDPVTFYENLENPIEKIVMKKIALHNISKAQNNYELVELMNELKSIDRDARASASYFNEQTESLVEDLKEQTFGQEVASVIASVIGVQNAHAQSFLNSNNFKNVHLTDPSETPAAAETPTAPETPAAPKPRAPLVHKMSPEEEANLRKSIAENEKIAADNHQGLEEQIAAYKGRNSGQAAAAEKEADKSTGEWIFQPQTRAVGNGILGAWTGVYMGFLIDQTVKSEARAKVLKEMAGQFAGGTAVGDCTPTDRNNPAKPNCYCFNSDWTKNTAHADTNACQSLRGPQEKPTTTTGGTGGGGRVCINKNSGIDASCQCKTTNSCLKVRTTKVSGLTTDQFKMLSTPISSANAAYSGGIAGTSADLANLRNNAARLRTAANNALKKNPTLKAGLEKKMKTMSDRLIASAKGLSPISPSASGNRSLSNPQQALNELKKDIEKSKAEGLGAAASGSNSSGSMALPESQGEQPLEFGMTEQEAITQEKELSQAMNKNYNLNDINKSSSENLFDVLTNRYKRSGMRRLFDEEGKTKADKPAETDINK